MGRNLIFCPNIRCSPPFIDLRCGLVELQYSSVDGAVLRLKGIMLVFKKCCRCAWLFYFLQEVTVITVLQCYLYNTWLQCVNGMCKCVNQLSNKFKINIKMLLVNWKASYVPMCFHYLNIFRWVCRNISTPARPMCSRCNVEGVYSLSFFYSFVWMGHFIPIKI